MDYYISKFYDAVDNCKVLDYAVFLEKKQGFAKFNLFAAYTQLVVYITDKGNYCLTVDGLGTFGYPERNGFELMDDGKIACYRNKQYKFSRKQKNGKYLSLQEFAKAILK